MPKLPPRLINCAVYIYKSVHDATEGSDSGACGFIVLYKSQYEGSWFGHYYIITNEHVIRRAGATPAIRINKRDGTTEIVSTSESAWKRHPDGDDVAAYPIAFHSDHDVTHIEVGDFVKEEKLPYWIGVGTETLMIGRFSSHDGKQRNAPVVRYGNIAMMPKEPIKLESGVNQQSFLVEMRSIPGASGSAVLALYSYVQFFEHSAFGTPKVEPPHNWVALLGVDFCHLNTIEAVRVPDGTPEGRPVPEKYFVKSNAGMAGVVPAWRIRGLLESEELMEDRLAKDKKSSAERKMSKAVTFDSADDAIQPFTKADFESALQKASRRTGSSSQSGEGKK